MLAERESLFLRHQIEQRIVDSGYCCPLEITGAGTEIFICCGFSDNVLDKRINVSQNETEFFFDCLMIGSFFYILDSFLVYEHLEIEKTPEVLGFEEVKDERIPEELSCKLQGALPSISLVSQTGVLSAFINDVAPDMMYAQLVYGYGKENDLLICLSTSGNSKNVFGAVKVGKGLGIKVIGLTGALGGKLKDIADICICAPETETFKIQELHLPIYHYLCAEVERQMF